MPKTFAIIELTVDLSFAVGVGFEFEKSCSLWSSANMAQMAEIGVSTAFASMQAFEKNEERLSLGDASGE